MQTRQRNNKYGNHCNLNRRIFLTQAGVAATAITAGTVLSSSSAISATNDDMLLTDEIIYASATSLARRIRTKQLSSEEVVKAHIDRIKAVNPTIRAVVQLAEEQALERAREADQALARNENWGSLHGIPVTIKDEWETEGIISTSGARIWENHIPEKDATAVARLKAAGAIVLGKTNMPEFGAAFESDNLVYGRTCNPYDLERTPGGSSGGEAAIIACGGSPLGLGGDGGGSIRMPAHFCGIAGLKPTWGRIPQSGSLLFGHDTGSLWATGGPMARYVEDLDLGLKVMSGPDPLDPYSVPGVLRNYRNVDVSQLKIAFYVSDAFRPATSEVQNVVRIAASTLSNLNADIQECERPGMSGEDFWRMTICLLHGDPKPAEEPSGPEWQEFVDFAERMRKKFHPSRQANRAWAHEQWFRFQQEMRRFLLEEFDAIICPAWPRTAYRHGESWEHENGRENIEEMVYTACYNAARVPAAVVRGGTSSTGLPIGVQIVAGPWREEIVLAVAEVLEHELGGWQAPVI
jgi:amidase